jgi:hypothetical protein
MARGGINKALVRQARDTLLSKGKNPSIDTLRIELGNTGSKTTIHRYLKELELEESTRLDDETLLSNTLKELVVKLASQLHQEAQNVIGESDERHATQIQVEQSKNAALEKNNQVLAQEIEQLKNQLKDIEQKYTALSELHQTESLKNQRLEQQVTDLNKLLEEKDNHVTSLEEKHQHSREALEHYRTSVKDQRDQEQRRHEHQVQQLQVEIRNLNQTLSIKQTDITQLNKDNGRLVSELNTTQRALSDTKVQLRTVESESQRSLQRLGILESQLKDSNNSQNKLSDKFKDLESQLALSEKLNHEKDVGIGKLKSELEIKNQIFDKLKISAEPNKNKRPL